MVIIREGAKGTGFITSACALELEETGPPWQCYVKPGEGLLFVLGAKPQEGLPSPGLFCFHILIITYFNSLGDFDS